VLTAALAVLGAHLVVGGISREPPNHSRIEAGLYLGGWVAAPPRDVSAVLNLCEVEDPYQAPFHRWEPIRDAEPAPGLDWLRRQVAFIEAQRQEKRGVFVHCRNGVSRSGMVVAAHLMARYGWSRDDALAFMRSRREVVRPNPAFMRLLLEWERAVSSREEGKR
jgi:hypothetical protein